MQSALLASATAPIGAVHFTLQGKGGVGKSLVSSILAQYLLDRGAGPQCVDTDPVNQTLLGYGALQATHLALTREGSPKIDERGFDSLLERLLSEDAVFVVDNGAATFVPLSTYLLESDALRLLREAGRQVYIHVVVTGGQAMLETLTGFKALATASPGRNVVVWLNEFFGPIVDDRKSFTDMRVYADHADKVRGIVRIAARNPDTFGRDFAELIASKRTFAEALFGPGLSIMSRQRLKMIQRDIYDQLDRIAF